MLLISAAFGIAFIACYFSPTFNDPTNPMLYINFPAHLLIFMPVWIGHYFTCIVPSKVEGFFDKSISTHRIWSVFQHYGFTLKYFGERLPAIFGYKAEKDFQFRYTASDFRKGLTSNFEDLREFAVQEWTVNRDRNVLD